MGLTVQGDPQGWADLGSAFGNAAATLEAELAGVDLNGAQALARTWYGPTSAAFSASWASRRSRYEQLIDHLYSAGRAVAGYGQRLGELQEQAWSVESRAIEAGLRVTPLGDAFMLPPEAELLPAPARMIIEHALADALQGAERLFADVAAAAEDLMFTLGPVAALLEDFCLAGLVAAYLPEFAHDFVQLLKGELIGQPLDLVAHAVQDVADGAAADATAAAYALQDLRDLGFTEAEGALPAAISDASHASAIAAVADKGPAIVAIAFTTGQVVWGAFGEHEGVVGSLEKHAGDMTDTAVQLGLAATAGVALVTAGAPVALVAVGVVVVGAGVGAAVQTIVDHRHAIIHEADSAVHDVEHLL
jgi:hypothetical protein